MTARARLPRICTYVSFAILPAAICARRASDARRSPRESYVTDPEYSSFDFVLKCIYHSNQMANGVTLPRSTAFRFAPAVRSVSRLAFPFVDVVVVPWSHFDCVRKKKQNVFPLHFVCSCPVNPANASTFFLWAWEEQNGPAVVLATCGSLATSVERQGRNRLCEPILFAQGIENEERPRTASERFRRSR